MLLLVGAAGWTATRAADNINASGFELEGDIHPNTSFLANDWESLNCSGQSNTASVHVFLQEPAGTSLFTIGSKDILDLDDLFWKDGSVPDKSDLIDAYAAQYLAQDTDGNGTRDTILISGGDRFDNSGDMFIGAWFF